MVVKLGLLHSLRTFKNRVLRDVFGAKKEPVRVCWRKSHKGKVRYFNLHYVLYGG